ncbi:MAG: RNA methyltransferase [Clostridiales bacterium]|nr:RNA methyltransferase [Clostridiales bacterium]
MIIISKDNKIIKQVKYLRTKKGRYEHNLFIVEGARFVDEITGGFNIKYLVFSQTFTQKNETGGYHHEYYIVSDKLFNELSDTFAPQGILAVVEQKQYSVDNLSKGNSFFLIAENIQDPGNLGTLIRTADAAGADAIFLSGNCVDVYNPKVVRATAGSIFHLPVIENNSLDILIGHLKRNGIKIYAAHLKGKKYPYEIDLTENIAILIGNEGNGLSEYVSRKADLLLKIPMLGMAESLNASVAGGILLYEVVRQRINNLC